MLYFGDDIPATFYFGDSPVERLYFGDDLVWTSAIDPQQLTYSTPGEYVFTTPDGSGYHIDRVAVGGGNGGHWYEFARQHNGGKAGSFNWDSITEGVDFTAGDEIAITVGAGGGAGTASTVEVAGNTLTAAAGESGNVYGYAGQSVNTGNTNGNKDLLLNGVTYVGGSGGTGSGSNDSAASPLAPGGGGWGSNSNGVSGRPGGHGRVWLNVYQ